MKESETSLQVFRSLPLPTTKKYGAFMATLAKIHEQEPFKFRSSVDGARLEALRVNKAAAKHHIPSRVVRGHLDIPGTSIDTYWVLLADQYVVDPCSALGNEEFRALLPNHLASGVFFQEFANIAVSAAFGDRVFGEFPVTDAFYEIPFKLAK